MSQDPENPYAVTEYGAVVDYLLLDGNVNVEKNKGLGQLILTRTSVFALRAGNTSMQTGMAAGGLIGALIGYWLDKRRAKKLPPSEHLSDPELQNLEPKAHKRIAQSRLLAKLPLETKTFELKINNTHCAVQVKDRFDDLLHEWGMDTGIAGKVSDIKAPMPGLVVEVKVSNGQEIKKGDPVIVLEAMKMENILKATADAVVKSVIVKKGSKVEKNEVLVTLQ